ncbi:S8 family serine peptidase [Parvularcula sp. ZS-1/3]|uniref:S8 family serine peptidase n=1 Tax=Parvularcula mediterranea TaxID=2732508 RepID=A0A7Y3RNY3_9PROT|nr:S8 family serine peptidase [Parvularcula mediterranea]NNU17582.1 S8 family serine peptidase [Parvularcula mediterranea]
MTLARTLLTAVAALTLVSACTQGGGGNDTPPAPTPTPAPPPPPPPPPPPANEAPVASFTFSCTELVCDFTNTSTDDNAVTGQEWNFGDGTIVTDPNPAHTYAADGTYTVTLIVSDAEGETGSATQDVTVSAAAPPPPPPPPPPPGPTQGTINGQLLADAILVVDSDLNDAPAGASSNDDTSSAQPINNDAEVRGWVFCSGRTSGSTPCFAGSDQQDYYRAELQTGQRISLTIADFDPNIPDQLDLDLYLYDESGTLVTFSFAFSAKIEQIVVPEDGTYFVVADAFAGGSNYILQITPPSSTTPQPIGTMHLKDMAPERLILAQPQLGPLPVEIAEVEGRRALVRPEAGEERARQVHLPVGSLLPPESGPLSLSFAEEAFGILPEAARDPEYAAKLALLHRMKVANAERGGAFFEAYAYPRMHAVDPPPDPNLQWNLGAVHWQEALEDLEANIADPDRPLVAILDSGVLSAHPKIAPVMVDARDFVPSFIDGDGFDAEAEEDVVTDEENPGDCFDFHGTHVATIATAPREGDPINGRDMVGGLPFADLMMLKLGYNQGDRCRLIVGDVPAAIRYAAGLTNNSGELPARRADVINMSFGGSSPDSATRAAVEEAAAAGVIIVASAGNSGDDPSENGPNYPASYPEVFSVAATTIDNDRANYSSFYPQVEIAAPGGESSTDNNGDGLADSVIGGVGRLSNDGTRFVARYALYQGTSMAAPMAASGFAIMKSIYPELTTEQAHRVVEEGLLTEDIADPGRDDETGFGLLDFRKMVDIALQLRADALDLPPDFRLNPPVIDLGNIRETETIEITRAGDPAFTIDSLVVSVEGSDVVVPDPVAETIDAQGFGTYELNIDRNAFEPGEYFGEITVTASNGSSKLIPLSFDIPEPSLLAETAPARILLERQFEPGTFIQIQELTPGGAGSEFTLEGLSDGFYRLRFTTDMDADGEICDAGELGGTFPGGDCLGEEVFEIPGQEGELIEAVLRRLPE